jgi:hypothetical protein
MNEFEIYDTETIEFSADIIKEAKKRRVRPICIKFAQEITRHANQIGRPEKLKNMSIVVDILRIGFLGSRMSQRDAEQAADLSEGSMTRFFGEKENEACQKLREAWQAVKTAGKILLQDMAVTGAMKDSSGKMALELLKAQYPEEFGKQVTETTSHVQIQHQHILELPEKQLEMRIRQLIDKSKVIELKPNDSGTYEPPRINGIGETGTCVSPGGETTAEEREEMGCLHSA